MMLDDQDAGAAPSDFPDEIAQTLDLQRRQPGRGFVEQKKARTRHQRAGDFHEAQLAVLEPLGLNHRKFLEADHAQGKQGMLAQGFFHPAGDAASQTAIP